MVVSKMEHTRTDNGYFSNVFTDKFNCNMKNLYENEDISMNDVQRIQSYLEGMNISIDQFCNAYRHYSIIARKLANNSEYVSNVKSENCLYDKNSIQKEIQFFKNRSKDFI